MAYYNCILIDVDNTLLDFDLAEQRALAEALEKCGLPADDAVQQQYHQINAELWEQLNRGEIRREKLIVARFERLLAALGVEGKPAELNRCYMEQLATHAEIIPGAEEFLRELSEVATLAAVSNGAEKVEYGRLKLSGLERYFDEILVSEKVGIAKPNPKIFQMALRKLGIENPAKALVVGDSLAADIQGGLNAKLDTCWVNLSGAENSDGPKPKFEIKRFEELYPIVMEPDELEQVGLKKRKHQGDAL